MRERETERDRDRDRDRESHLIERDAILTVEHIGPSHLNYKNSNLTYLYENLSSLEHLDSEKARINVP